MQTQNTDVILPLLEMRVEKALQQGCALVERLNRNAARRTVAGRPPRSDEGPPLIRADHNTYIDRELSAAVHDRKRKRRVLQPRTKDQEVSHHPALTQAFENVSSVAWVAAILAIIGVLTAMLMIGIAISV